MGQGGSRIYGAVRELLHSLGLDPEHYGTPSWNPLGGLIQPGQVVIIKPNFVLGRNNHPGRPVECSITHGSVLRPLVDYAYIALRGEGKVIICDAPQHDAVWDEIMQHTGVPRIQEFYGRHVRGTGFGLTVLDLRPEAVEYRHNLVWVRTPLRGDPLGYVDVDLGNCSEMDFADASGFYGADYDRRSIVRAHTQGRNTYNISRTVLSADTVIAVPKLKVHKKCGVTLNLKLMVGINGTKNLIPHYRVPTSQAEGDCFPSTSFLDRADRLLMDRLLGGRRWAIGKYLFAFLWRKVVFRAARRVFPLTDTMMSDGNWYGNDTVWRATVDLMKILLYADRTGVMQPTRQRGFLSIVDGVLGGEGEGPLSPSPVPAGLLLGGTDPVGVDLVASRLMGFDPQKIPMLRNASMSRCFQITSVGEGGSLEVCGDPACREAFSAGLPLVRFEPHPGWKHHIELGDVAKGPAHEARSGGNGAKRQGAASVNPTGPDEQEATSAMKQVFSTGSGFVVEEVPAPACLPGGVLVRTTWSAISPGTETSTLRGQSSGAASRAAARAAGIMRLGVKGIKKLVTDGPQETLAAARHRSVPLMPVGYSCAGVVVECGDDVQDFAPGNRVACAGAGYANHAEYVWVPENLVVRLPDSVAEEDGAYVALGAIAMQGIRRARVSFGEQVLVIGLGLLGQLTIGIGKAAGLRLTGYDPDRGRVQRSLTMGAAEGFSSVRSLDRAVERITRSAGFDAAILCAATSSGEPLDNAMRWARVRGRIVVVGDVALNVKRELMFRKELDLVMSTSYGPGRYDPSYEERGQDYPVGHVRWTERRNMQEFITLLADRKLVVRSLTDRVVSVEQAPAGYAALIAEGKRPIGVALRYSTTAAVLRRTVRLASPKIESHPPGTIGIAILGAGSFAQSTHIPAILRHPDCSLQAVMNLTGAKAQAVARKYGVPVAATGLSDLLDLPAVDAVFVCSQHASHADHAIACLEAGKHVFLEKPLAITEEQLRRLEHAVASARSVMTVGFNRRYSPYAEAVRRFIAGSPSPAMISYRINAGGIPHDHWIQRSDTGGGRILGEICHFVDLCGYLTGGKVVDIHAATIPVNGTSVRSRDNVSILLRYTNGSVATIVYVAVGGSSLPKERIEVFTGGGAAVIDDWRGLSWFGVEDRDARGREQEKGFGEQLDEFVRAVHGTENRLLTFADAAETTRIVLSVDQMVRKG